MTSLTQPAGGAGETARDHTGAIDGRDDANADGSHDDGVGVIEGKTETAPAGGVGCDDDLGDGGHDRGESGRDGRAGGCVRQRGEGK